MKKFMQGLLINFALIVLGAHVFSSAFTNNWMFSKYVLELFLTTVVIRLLLLLTNRFSSRYPILEYLLEFGMVLGVVLGLGWLFGWYTFDFLWVIVITVAAVYAAVYAVGAGRTKRDVAFINAQIQQRKNGKQA